MRRTVYETPYSSHFNPTHLSRVGSSALPLWIALLYNCLASDRWVGPLASPRGRQYFSGIFEVL